MKQLGEQLAPVSRAKLESLDAVSTSDGTGNTRSGGGPHTSAPCCDCR